jgi:hypothetical protein
MSAIRDHYMGKRCYGFLLLGPVAVKRWRSIRRLSSLLQLVLLSQAELVGFLSENSIK